METITVDKAREWYNRQMILSQALKGVLDDTDHRVDLIVEMIQDHGVMVISEAREYVNAYSSRDWNFKAFLFGAKIAVIHQLQHRVSDGMILALAEIVPDASRYGAVRTRGVCNEQVAELFMDMLTDGVVEERIGELISYDCELYGGAQDEPEDDDADIDRLLDGLADLMEGHGISGDVRAKAKDFLMAVAADTLDIVVDGDE